MKKISIALLVVICLITSISGLSFVFADTLESSGMAALYWEEYIHPVDDLGIPILGGSTPCADYDSADGSIVNFRIADSKRGGDSASRLWMIPHFQCKETHADNVSYVKLGTYDMATVAGLKFSYAANVVEFKGNTVSLVSGKGDDATVLGTVTLTTSVASGMSALNGTPSKAEIEVTQKDYEGEVWLKLVSDSTRMWLTDLLLVRCVDPAVETRETYFQNLDPVKDLGIAYADGSATCAEYDSADGKVINCRLTDSKRQNMDSARTFLINHYQCEADHSDNITYIYLGEYDLSTVHSLYFNYVALTTSFKNTAYLVSGTGDDATVLGSTLITYAENKDCAGPLNPCVLKVTNSDYSGEVWLKYDTTSTRMWLTELALVRYEEEVKWPKPYEGRPANAFCPDNSEKIYTSHPYQIKDANTVVGTQFSISADANIVGISCPSWGPGNAGGNMTFALYAFDTSYEKTISGTPIATHEFVDYGDNYTMGFEFDPSDPLPAGEYVLTMQTNTPEKVVGFWCANDTNYPGQAVYINGEYNKNMCMRMCVNFVTAPSGDPYGKLTLPQTKPSYSDFNWTIPEGGGKFTIGEEFLQCPEFYNHVWLDSDFVMDGSADFTIELVLDIVSMSNNADVINKDYISAAFLFNRNDKAGLEIHPNTQGKTYLRIDGTRKDVSESPIPVGTSLTVKIEYDKDEATMTYYINDQVAGTTAYNPAVHTGTFSIRGAWMSYKVTKVTYLDHIEPNAAEILADAKTAALAELENVYNAKIAALTKDDAKSAAKAAYDAAVAEVNAAADVDAVNTAATNGKAAINDVVDPVPTADVFTIVILATVVMMGAVIVLKRKVRA